MKKTITKKREQLTGDQKGPRLEFITGVALKPIKPTAKVTIFSVEVEGDEKAVNDALSEIARIFNR